jgi:antitoxin component YwqK of YwqJK toxin-antitoxin module
VRICLTNSLGKLNGIYKAYYENGQLYSEVNYINDKKNGIYNSYYENGQLRKKVNYIDYFNGIK